MWSRGFLGRGSAARQLRSLTPLVDWNQVRSTATGSSRIDPASNLNSGKWSLSGGSKSGSTSNPTLQASKNQVQSNRATTAAVLPTPSAGKGRLFGDDLWDSDPNAIRRRPQAQAQTTSAQSSSAPSRPVPPNSLDNEVDRHYQPEAASPTTSPTEDFTPAEILDAVLKFVPSNSTLKLGEVLKLIPADMAQCVVRQHHGLGYFLKRHGSHVVQLNGDLLSRRTDVASSRPAPEPSPGVVEELPPAWRPAEKREISSSPKDGSEPTAKPQAPQSVPGKGTAAPPPPPPFARIPGQNIKPLHPVSAYGGLSGVGFHRTGGHSPQEILELLVDFIPTFWADVHDVEGMLPPQVKDLYAGKLKFSTFLRKYRFFFDVRNQNHGQEVRLREEIQHPRRGFADKRFSSTLVSSDLLNNLANAVKSTTAATIPVPPSINQPPKPQFSAQTILSIVYSCCPEDFVKVEIVQGKLPKEVTAIAQFQTPSGIGGIIEQNPEFFQIVEGKVRKRPVGVAPNALDSRTIKDSPMPDIFAKILQAVPTEPTQSVDTAVLLAGLEEEEKQRIRTDFRSFPRFLRSHGGQIMVSPDNLKVRRFDESLMPPRPLKVELPSPTDAVSSGSTPPPPPPSPLDTEIQRATSAAGEVPGALELPSSMPAEPGATWALRELFDSLPLLQVAELEDVLFGLAPAIRAMLPSDREELLQLLSKYPNYFEVWPYPDNPTVTIIKRTAVNIQLVPLTDLIRALYPLIPQGGIACDKLLRKVPPPIQRYLYRHGFQKTLGEHPQHFAVAAGKVMKLG
jgi:hypothetical protein